jgi:excisionase family DNA binding protein
MTEKLLTVEQVQDILHLSKRTVLQLTRDKELNGFKVGREWRFEPAAIDAFIDRQKQKTMEVK